MEINVKIKDKSKAREVISLLENLPYVEINIKKKFSLWDIFRFWKKKEVKDEEIKPPFIESEISEAIIASSVSTIVNEVLAKDFSLNQNELLDENAELPTENKSESINSNEKDTITEETIKPENVDLIKNKHEETNEIIYDETDDETVGEPFPFSDFNNSISKGKRDISFNQNEKLTSDENETDDYTNSYPLSFSD